MRSRTPGKTFRYVTLFSLAITFCAAVGRAQVVAWQTPTGIQGDSDISTAGTYVDAIQTYAGPHVQGGSGPATMVKIGDTVFNLITGADATYGDGTISVTAPPKALFFSSNTNPIQSGQFNAFPTGPQFSADYSALVSNGSFFNAGPIGSINFSKLTAGHIYQVQIWCFVQDGATSLTNFTDDSGNTLTLDAAVHVPKTGSLTAGSSYGQFALGWFQAKDTTASIDWAAGEGSPYPLISAIALRDVTSLPSAATAVAAAKANSVIDDGTAPFKPPVKSPPGFDGVDVWKNVTYTKVNKHPLKLDIYIPENAPHPVPLVVYIHGGGWSALDKTEGFANFLLGHGFAVASIDYRLTQEEIFPAQVYDCKAAVRWLRAHASDYGYGADKIGALGDSAGGHLVSMLGVTGKNPELEGTEGNPGVSSSVQAVADYFGPSNMLTIDPTVADNAIPRLIGGQPSQIPDKAKKASPIFYVTSSACPFVIVQGDKDVVVNPQQSIDLNDALQKAGVDSQLYLIKGAGHGANDGKAIDLVVALFKKYLQ
jgi:acetyl esterase/lipase